MKSSHLILIIVIVGAILVLFPGLIGQIGRIAESRIPQIEEFSALTSLLSTNSAGEITGHTRGNVEVVGNRVIMHDGPTTLPQNIWAVIIIGFFALVAWKAKG